MDVIAVPYADPFSFAGALAALGDAVVVLEPAQLREEVLAHLRSRGPGRRRPGQDRGSG